ncbi:hypothetical protein [Pseudobacteriovorax antillogorgiicola]|uniref:Uncharacterized protein n=1 Tax=Pseudobacteriovorax antillogorgiicola TaxID=1513793 RepID=A0A1Y6CM73_9BACT|nr:hypothetical protein [Pseudobacteriovorax antillogorgiicola]TCS47680.1 hypothetical protein EDD56_120121 [Pseudobacteriovorax antillogorgiicola]SMF59588.1 hypothetical protein SAMN06296036_12019 [Pseudobacteriovorax antillogorgiicola]
MTKEKNHNILESLKAAIIHDPHLLDRVLTIIRNTRSTTGQSLEDYMKQKEIQEKDIIEQRRRQSTKF